METLHVEICGRYENHNLIDVLIQTGENTYTRFATYSIKKDTITFYGLTSMEAVVRALMAEWPEVWSHIQNTKKRMLDSDKEEILCGNN